MIAPSPDMPTYSARQLVMRYGWNATAYQILNKGLLHWAAPSVPGVVGYVQQGPLIVAAGPPICAEESLAHVAADFERWAHGLGRRVCYFGVESRLRGVLCRTPGHALIAIGAQPVWDPHDWADVMRRRPSLRSQVRRARNKGVLVEEVGVDTARQDPELRACLAEWLGSKGFPPMHFLVEPDTLDGVLDDRIILVATEPPRGGTSRRRAAAFLVASPVPCRNGFLVEQIARRRDAPNGTAEYLIDAAMSELVARRCTYATLGLVALAENAGAHLAQNPLWLRVLTSWARAHGRRFYNFAGLEAFRTKMAPQRWDPVYAIVNEPHFTPSTLHAVAAAFCKGSPELAVAKAMGKALRAEVGRLQRRFAPSS